jgi:hypothetical protein
MDNTVSEQKSEIKRLTKVWIARGVATKQSRIYYTLLIFHSYMAKNVTEIHEILSINANIQLFYYNKTKVGGFKWFQYMILKRQWGMFRAANVLIAALLLAIYSEYRQIYLMRADSDWMKNIWVDEQNRLRLRNTHFYEDSIQDCIIPVSMSHQCAALYYTFRSYEEINRYTLSKKNQNI